MFRLNILIHLLSYNIHHIFNYDCNLYESRSSSHRCNYVIVIYSTKGIYFTLIKTRASSIKRNYKSKVNSIPRYYEKGESIHKHTYK